MTLCIHRRSLLGDLTIPESAFRVQVVRPTAHRLLTLAAGTSRATSWQDGAVLASLQQDTSFANSTRPCPNETPAFFCSTRQFVGQSVRPFCPPKHKRGLGTLAGLWLLQPQAKEREKKTDEGGKKSLHRAELNAATASA